MTQCAVTHDQSMSKSQCPKKPGKSAGHWGLRHSLDMGHRDMGHSVLPRAYLKNQKKTSGGRP